jgi:hypothetical protein
MDLNELIKNPEQIKGLIQVLQALLPKEEAEKIETENIEVVEKPKNERTANTIKTRSGQKRSKSDDTYTNKFEQMAEFGLHKEDTLVDKALSKFPPVARNREEVQPIQVVCRICGKKEFVNPSLIFDSASRYKCNNCSTQSG